MNGDDLLTAADFPELTKRRSMGRPSGAAPVGQALVDGVLVDARRSRFGARTQRYDHP
jgi:hypothetical protein